MECIGRQRGLLRAARYQVRRLEVACWLKRRWLVRESSEKKKVTPPEYPSIVCCVRQIRWQHENFDSCPTRDLCSSEMGVPYLLELLDGTLVDTTALVDQVCVIL